MKVMMVNEKYDLFAPRPKASRISPFELNTEGGYKNAQALVLRYAGCNLRCPLCYAWSYAWSKNRGERYKIQDVLRALNVLSGSANIKKIVWVRIQGGEPCLNFDRIINTITFATESLIKINADSLNYFEITRAIIQTNCLAFSELSPNEISNILAYLEKSLKRLDKGKLIFEVSFKSPNNEVYLRPQAKGYNVLLNKIIIPLWETGFNNIAIYPLAGLGPSIDEDNLFIIPVDSKFPEFPLFHPSTWSDEFRMLVDDFIQKIVPNYKSYNNFRGVHTNGGKKLAIEELEPTLFQTSWISGYARGYSEHEVNVKPIHEILRKLTDNVPENPQWKKWYNSWTSKTLFGRSNDWMQVLNQIPASNDPNNLLLKVREMGEYFYPSHPKGHYPHL